MRIVNLYSPALSANLIVYGVSHAVIDGVCAAVIFSVLKEQLLNEADFASIVLLYCFLGFGLQAVFGLATDYFKAPRMAALSGCVLTGLSALIFLSYPEPAIVLAGLGNALFHVGGGSISLNLTPEKAAAPGIFVAPGALGLLVGTLIGKSGLFIIWPAILILAILCVLMFAVEKPEMNYDRKEIRSDTLACFESIFLLLFLSIGIRSFVGSVLVFPWKSSLNLLFVLTLAVVLGKALGGILADKYGWINVAAGALALSIPFLVFGANFPATAILGMFLFNITMPVTLVGISNILPGQPGFAFGLPCFALLLGALPGFFPIRKLFADDLIIFIVILASTLSLYAGLRLYSKGLVIEESK